MPQRPKTPIRATPARAATRATTSSVVKAPKQRLKLEAKKTTPPPATPPTEHINQWGYFAGPAPISGWTVDGVESALVEHKRGMFQQSGILAEDMASNPWITQCLDQLFMCFSTSALNITEARGVGAGAIRCRDFVREVWPDIMPDTILRDLHRNWEMMGISAAAMDWVEYKDGKDRVWLPNIKPWQPQLTYYQQFADADSVDMGALVATTLNRGLVRVDAGESRWVVFSKSRLKPWLRGNALILGEAFLGDTFNFRDNQAFQDRFGRGIIKLKHPVSWKDEEIITAAQTLRAGGGGGVMPCPTGPKGEPLVDVDIVRADGTGFMTFDSTEKRVRSRIAVALLGQDMTTFGQTGGFAQARIHENGLYRKYDNIASCFGDAVLSVTPGDGVFRNVTRQWQPRDGVIRTQILKWLSLWNFGNADLAPYVWWDRTDDVREEQETRSKVLKDSAGALAQLGVAVEKLTQAGYEVNFDEMAASVGLPDGLLKKSKVAVETQPLTPAPAKKVKRPKKLVSDEA